MNATAAVLVRRPCASAARVQQRWLTKRDHPRAIDGYIDYFGDVGTRQAHGVMNGVAGRSVHPHVGRPTRRH